MAEIVNKNFTVSGLGNPDTRAQYFELREPVLFPFCLTPVPVETENNERAVDAAMKRNRLLAVFYEMPSPAESMGFPFTLTLPTFEYRKTTRSAVGVLARIVKELKFPDGSRRVILRGIRRIKCDYIRSDAAGGVEVAFTNLEDLNGEGNEAAKELAAHQRSVMLSFQELTSMLPNLPEELNLAVLNAPTAGRFADIITDALNFSRSEKVFLLSQTETAFRLETLAVLINRELEVLRMGLKIQSEVHEAMSQSQREFYLREQLRTIQRELGEESSNPDLVALRKRLAAADLPENVVSCLKNELDRLDQMPQNAPEYHIGYNYVSMLLDLPWNICTEDVLDCRRAAEILDEDHYGLEDVKKRILEYLAVLQLRGGGGKAPVLCLAGPPGVGKTSLGRSIARAMGRKFVRISLGGVRDEAEIRGHRRTYIGAMPGRIIKALKRVGSKNPVFMLDEVDKLANDFRGDPSSALLEVLDPEQNSTFADNYVEMDFDLSQVFFIATANVLEAIPAALRDRMEVIRLPGYTQLEKRQIARRYLVPRQIRENGLGDRKISIPLPAIDAVIDDYTMESGVRELDRKIATLCRRLAMEELDGKLPEGAVKISPARVREVLGARIYRQKTPQTPGVGCALGLAWTGVGGVTLPVETMAIPGGKGELKLTGSLGKVMQESAGAAFSLVRSQAAAWGIDAEYFTSHDFHIHVPDGATPKDGPSAGITIFSALVSLLRNRPLRPHLAMTGEITLSGKVSAIGGLREKTVAALRAKATRLIVPQENAEEFGELPAEIRDRLEVSFVSNYREVLKAAFESVE